MNHSNILYLLFEIMIYHLMPIYLPPWRTWNQYSRNINNNKKLQEAGHRQERTHEEKEKEVLEDKIRDDREDRQDRHTDEWMEGLSYFRLFFKSTFVLLVVSEVGRGQTGHRGAKCSAVVALSRDELVHHPCSTWCVFLFCFSPACFRIFWCSGVQARAIY